VLLGPVWIAAVVLAAAGAGKLLRPGAAAPTMRALRLPAGAVWVRGLGLVEVAVAVAAVVAGGTVAPALLAVAYLGLAVVAERLRRRPATSGGCGCFGRSGAPVGVLHVAVDAGCTAVAAGAAVTGLPSVTAAVSGLPAGGAAHLVLVTAGAAAVVALLTVLPETLAAARRTPAPDPRVHLFGPTISRRPSAGHGAPQAVRA